MPEQLPTTGDLENAQRIVLSEARYSEEHSHPCINLIEHFLLRQGEKSRVVPKVGRMTAAALTPGVDIVDSEDIGMTTIELTASMIGLKVILDDELVLQANDDITAVVGRQMGDAIGRLKETDIIALFAALNGGTAYGADNINFTARNFAAAIATAKASRFGSPLVAVHHPNAVFALVSSLAPVGATGSVAIPHGLSEDLLKDFYRVTVGGVPVFEAGEIAVVAGTDSGLGAIFHKGAMAMLDSIQMRTEPQRDASLRATELVVTSRYGVFEIDDTRGAPLRYEIGNPATNN